MKCNALALVYVAITTLVTKCTCLAYSIKSSSIYSIHSLNSKLTGNEHFSRLQALAAVPTHKTVTSEAQLTPTIQSHHSKSLIMKSLLRLTTVSTIILASTPAINLYPVLADQGAIKTSTLAETKAAILQVKACIEGLNEMEQAANKGDYPLVAKILSSSPYETFEKAATVIVRSDKLTAEDKVTLGTIKRYGVVADAIIMLGGLAGELKSAGLMAGDSNKSGIEDSADMADSDESDADVGVNGGEVRRFIKLARESLMDVYKIASPVLSMQ